MALPPGVYMINGYRSDTILTGYEGPTGVKTTRTPGEIQDLGAKYMGIGKWDLGEGDQQIDSWSVALIRTTMMTLISNKKEPLPRFLKL